MMEPEYYVYTGRAGEVVPRHVTHVLIAKALNFVRGRAFQEHPNVQEVICHDGVEKIEQLVFHRCHSLRRVIMPGVKEIERWAFGSCSALTYIECGKLERIGIWGFHECESLSSIDLPSIKIVEGSAFASCTNLINAKFGKDLESIRGGIFSYCRSLERFALPLKDDLIYFVNTFVGCVNLTHIDLVEAEVLNETIASLHMDGWKNDMNGEIESIHRILSNIPAGHVNGAANGEKAQVIRAWIRSVLRKIIHYKAEHRSYLNVAAATLLFSLPNDLVFKNILPFLELPSYTFQGEENSD